MGFNFGQATDKNGNYIRVGDLVWLNVFEIKLRHNGVKRMLGRIVHIAPPPDYPATTISITLGAGLTQRARKPTDVELAVGKEFEKMFEQQLDDYRNELTLFIFENTP